MMLGGQPRREPSEVERLLGQLQKSVDRAKAEREERSERTVRCDRSRPHGRHRYVATPWSGIDLECPGLRFRRTLSELLTDVPALADMPAPGVTAHVLGVMAA